MKEYYVLLKNYKYTIIKAASIKKANRLAIKIYGEEVVATMTERYFLKNQYDKDYKRHDIF